VATHDAVITENMRPIASDLHADASPLRIDWLRMGPYATAGTFVSRVLDAGAVTTWGSMSWNGSGVSGIAMSVRFGDTPTPDGSWTAFTPVASSGSPISGSSRYVQYQAVLSGDGSSTPVIADVTISALGAGTLISVGDVIATEGNSGTTTATFTLRLSRSSSSPVTVLYATADGTARAPSDYTGVTGSVTFAPGSMAETVPITIAGDAIQEPDETLALNLMSPTNAALLDSQGIVTIVNDDSTPAVTINDVSVIEGNTGTLNAVFTVSLSAASTQTVTVDYATANGTAIAGATGDYLAATGTLTFAPGTTTRQVMVTVRGDTLDEVNETFFVNLSGAGGATIIDAQGLGTILDNDPTPSLTINNVTVTEGNTGTANAVFTVSLSAASGLTVTVNYATADGTAGTPAEYLAGSGTVTFAPGTTTQTITVAVNGDVLDELNETFFVNLSGAVNATIADAQGQGTINDDDATPSLTINNVAVTEGNTGTTVNAVFTVTLSAASGQIVTVNYATANGTATAGATADYLATSGALTFPTGTTTQSVTVTVRGDALDEANETFFVNLSGAGNATIADAQGQGTINDDDPSPSLSINDVTVTEGNTGNVSAVFTVTLSTVSGQNVTVNYATANGTATGGSSADFFTTSGTLTFGPGTTTQSITVTVRGDTADEVNETFFVNLSNPGNATITDAQGQGTINDNDNPPSLSIDNETVTEGNTANTNAVFNVTLSAASGQTITVNYATANGTATAGTTGDYLAASGTLTFAPGTTNQTITVTVRPDTLDEPNETYFVNLSGATNATIADGQGQGTINDNDATPSLTINNVTVTETNTGTVNAVFTVTLSAASGQTVTVNYATANGSATAPGDYTAASGTLTFASGVVTQTITIAVVGDTAVEGNENFLVNLTGPSNATLADGQGSCTILNND
jgi:hypothetical protein